MIRETLAQKQRNAPISLRQAPEVIYAFLLGLVKKYHPNLVLAEFKSLFLICQETEYNPQSREALLTILRFGTEQLFFSTIKRGCYILINNWNSQRESNYITLLIDSFLEVDCHQTKLNLPRANLQSWLNKFTNSQDYQELLLFTYSPQDGGKKHWSKRYKSYLLVPQYLDNDNSQEQKEAALLLAQKLRYKFKFDLAMYTARSQSSFCASQGLNNPTSLGDEVLRLIKTILVKQGKFSHQNVANIFLKQIARSSYQDFKISLKKYLVYGISSESFVKLFEQKIAVFIHNLYQDKKSQVINDYLIIRTCNRICDYLITEDGKNPSKIFVCLLSQESALTVVMFLVKLILISPFSRNHLEHKVAQIIKYYSNYSEQECTWVINFLEIFHVAFSIYGDNQVRYNLLRRGNAQDSDLSTEELNDYLIFCQSNGQSA